MYIGSLAEIVQLLSVHSPVEGPTDIGAEQSDFDVIHFVDHRVLLFVSPEHFIAEEVRTYLDHGEKDCDGAKDSFGGCDA